MENTKRLCLVVLVAGCGDVAKLRVIEEPAPQVETPIDAGTPPGPDAGEPDAGLIETPPEPDAGAPDAGPADAGQPLPPPPLHTLDVGRMFSCAVSGGAAYCWGQNDVGQLGDGTVYDHSTATRITTLTQVTEVSAGGDHGCALTALGRVWCWGANGSGQLGLGVMSAHEAPRQLTLNDAVAVSAGEQGHTCALRRNGDVWCWGQGLINSSAPNATPTLVTGLPPASAISVGDHHVCALHGTEVWCWGNNYFGQLGDGTTTDRLTPAPVQLLPAATLVSAGNSYTCALGTLGDVSCWGRGESGQLGGSDPPQRTRPEALPGFTATSVATSQGLHTCATAGAGAVLCWGSNAAGQLGDGQSGLANVLAPVATDITDAVEVSAGTFHTCARRASGAVRCWGINSNGQLGDGHSGTLSSRSVAVSGLP